MRFFARPFAVRALPRMRAALPLAPAERRPVSFEKASRTRPAVLSTKPSPLSRDADFKSCSFRVVLEPTARSRIYVRSEQPAQEAADAL